MVEQSETIKSKRSERLEIDRLENELDKLRILDQDL
jgi:hypothetical protein